MSRESSDEYGLDGRLENGFDYDLQVWVKNRIILRCGHPETMDCGCNARKFAGLTLVEAKGFDSMEVQ